MHLALTNFQASLRRVRHLHGVHAAFTATLTTAVDLSDLLRAELVMAVSALDRYVHDLTRLGMLECHAGARPKTDAFNKFSLPMSAIYNLTTHASSGATLESQIREKHSFLSFQHPDKIADAIRLFSSVSLWSSVGMQLGISAQDAKAKLGLIVDRRNKIAHEADADPSYPNQLWPISDAIVNQMVNDVEATTFAIHAVCA